MKAKHSRGRPKDVPGNSPATTKVKEPRSRSPDSSEEVDFAFPILKTVDKARGLHCFSNILGRGKDEGVTMEDLDRLQPELETMLSTVAVRLRTLQAEIASMNSSEEAKLEKKGSQILGNKKRRTNENRVAKSFKDLARARDREANKVDGGSSENDTDTTNEPVFEPVAVHIPESSKLLLPKNDTPNKFWASVDPYCSDVTPETIKELEDLIASCDNDLVGIKIPPLGKHYTARWADEEMNEEKDASNLEKPKRKSTDSLPEGRVLLKRASALCNREKAPGPLVQRLVSALMEESVTSPLQESFMTNKIEETENGNYTGHLPYHTTTCFERRLRRELEVVGLLDSSPDDTDEILSEIKRCDEELKIVAAQNKEYLQNVLALAKQEMARQEIKNKIKAIDNEILEIFRKTTAAKLKKKQLQKKEKEQAWKALKDRETLLKTLESM